MSQPREQSYYEIALTNRQVMVSFVVLLCLVLAVFVSGVWLGQKDSDSTPEGEARIAEIDREATPLDDLEEFTLLSDRQEDGEAAEPQVIEPGPQTSPPPPARPAPPPPARPAPPPPARTAPPPPARPAPPPPSPPPPKVTLPAPAVTEGFVIQVLSTPNEDRAQRVLAQLKRGGYEAFLSPVQVGTQVHHRVRIGPFPSRPPAETAAKKVSAQFNFETWVTAASN